MPIAFEIQQGLSCVFTNLPNLMWKVKFKFKSHILYGKCNVCTVIYMMIFNKSAKQLTRHVYLVESKQFKRDIELST